MSDDEQDPKPTSMLSRASFPPPLVVHDQAADNAELRRENEFMARELNEMHREIAELKRQMPTPELMDFLRERKAAEDNAKWLWRMVKAHAPWLVVVLGMIGSGFYWVATHTITIGAKQ